MNRARPAPAAIHYLTTNGVGNAWVANELRILAREGVPFVLHALERPRTTFFDCAEVAAMNDATRPIYPLPVLGTALSWLLAPFLFRGRFFGALWNALTGPRESARVRAKTLGHLAVACHWARTVRGDAIAHIHSQWIHSGGSVAFYGAWLLGVPYSFTGHAADLFRERMALRDKIARARFIVCISAFHRAFYLEEGARPEQLVTVYCGIDVAHFAFREAEDPACAGHILSSGRLVEKKGFGYLIEACAELAARGVAFRCTIAGSGPLEAPLRTQVSLSGLDDVVTLTGEPLSQEGLPDFMRTGAVYCLPCVEASDGDVDGLPQMLMEAMACGLPAVSTDLVGIPDLIDETCGVLVAPNDSKALADALEALLGDPARRAALARAGRARVEACFNLADALDPLIARFRAELPS